MDREPSSRVPLCREVSASRHFFLNQSGVLNVKNFDLLAGSHRLRAALLTLANAFSWNPQTEKHAHDPGTP